MENRSSLDVGACTRRVVWQILPRPDLEHYLIPHHGLLDRQLRVPPYKWMRRYLFSLSSMVRHYSDINSSVSEGKKYGTRSITKYGAPLKAKLATTASAFLKLEHTCYQKDFKFLYNELKLKVYWIWLPIPIQSQSSVLFYLLFGGLTFRVKDNKDK